MRIENRTVVESVSKVVPIYIASDGKKYHSEEACLQHENALNAVQKITIPNPDCVYPYADYINPDSNYYTWVNIKNEADLKAVCDAYNVEFDDCDFGIYCIESSNYSSEGYVYNIDSSVDYAIKLLELAGFDTSTLKRKENT